MLNAQATLQPSISPSLPAHLPSNGIGSPQLKQAISQAAIPSFYPGLWRPPPQWNLSTSSTSPTVASTQKVKSRTADESSISESIASRIANRLATDHTAVLYPDTEKPFTDEEDVLNRLLPYHVFLHPRQDLEYPDRKGKRKAIEIETEIAETKFALQCFKRRRRLLERYRAVRIKSGKFPSPSNQTCVLTQLVLESDRSEVSMLQSQVRSVKTELERLQRDNKTPAPTSTPQRSSYYTNAPYSIAAANAYYRPYPFTFAAQTRPGQAGLTPLLAVPAVPVATVASQSTPTNSATNQPLSGSIPVQLPLSSLPALQALGINPVPQGTTLSTGLPPAAILKGQSNNGFVHLDINVSRLQPPQMSGLALLLNSLTSRPATTIMNVGLSQSSAAVDPKSSAS